MSTMTLIEDGTPCAVIVIDQEASSRERFAAEEAKRYLGRISGAEIGIVSSWDHSFEHTIFIGKKDCLSSGRATTERLPPEGFTIETEGDNLLLMGADDSGVEFAVYTFLELLCGIRWFWPGPTGEIIPHHRTLKIGDLHIREEPDFRWRRFGPGGPLWGPRDRWEKQRELGVSEAHQRELALWERRNRLGGWKIADGHAWVRIIPPGKYGEEHPEYFALVDGKRDSTPHDGKHGNQLCTTNPEMIEVFVKRVREYLDAHDVDAMSISPNDGAGFCECERCRALDSGDMLERGGRALPSITDRIFTFANQVAESIAETHPERYLLLLVYSQYSKPPKRMRLRGNVIAQFCLSSYRHWDEEIRARDLQWLRGLSQRSREVGIYEYYINGSWPDLPRLSVPLIADSIRVCHDLGARYYSPQAGDGFAINGLNYYIAAKLLWNVEADVESLLDDYYERCYGTAACMVRGYFGRLERAWREAGDFPSIAGPADYEWLLQVFSPQLVTDGERYLSEAFNAADSDDTRQRIEYVRKGLKYVELTLDAVARARALENRGLALFPIEEAQRRWQRVRVGEGMRRLLQEALEAWERRGRFVEELKEDYVVSYLWIKYNDENRQFNPLKSLRVMALGITGGQDAEAI